MRKLALCILSFATLSLSAVNYCATSSWGYAGSNVTGGGNATPTLVTNESQLASALNNSNRVILITQDITVTNHISSDKNNLTIMALPGKKLISNDQTQENSGILYLKGNNLLLRNLTFVGPGAYDIDGWDLLCLDKATNVWVDHCDFQDGCDGNFDIKGKSDNITVSWCRFRYLKAPRAGGKETDDHRFSNLVGSGATDAPQDGTYNITWAYCWWDNGCKARMTRCRNASQHFLNCYWNSSNAESYMGPQNADCYVEGCYIDGVVAKARIFFQNYGGTNGVTFVNCISKKGVPDDVTDRTVLVPTYSYTALSAAEAKSAVTNASCGAGATLTVTTSAEVSSSCDGGDTPVVPTEPVAYSGDCCINLGLGEAPSVANGGLEDEVFSQIIISYAFNHASSQWSEYGYLNLGSNNDTITFDFSNYYSVIDNVAFDVTIPNWDATKNTISYRWNKEGSYSKYTISSSALQTVFLTAPADARSFTIKRSASTGTQIQGICFQLEESIPSATLQLQNQSAARKVLRHGQVLILRDGKTYNLLGQSL